MSDSSHPNRREVVTVAALTAVGVAAVPRTAHAGDRLVLGLSRREIDADVRFGLRNLPTEPAKLARHLADLFAGILDKNNQRLAEQLAPLVKRPDDEF